MKPAGIPRAAAWLAALAVTLFAGCTSYVTTQVTAFSDWRGSDATRTYAFERSDEQRNSLEQATYEQIVAGELAPYAFRPVPKASARYLVALAYGVHDDYVNVAQPVYFDPWFPGPYWHRGPWGPFNPWWGPPMPAGYVNQTYKVFDRMLAIRITERATGKEVYSVAAHNTGDSPSLVAAMPYLARSALADFPLANGATRTVRLPVDKNGGPAPVAANERAVPAAPASAPGAASSSK